MSISQICLTCGQDLARTVSFRDPQYGLSVILCPQCGDFSVRSKHPLIKRWQQIRHVLVPLLALLVQLLVLGAITALTMVFCMIGAEQIANGSLPGPNDRFGRPIVLGLVCVLSIATGAWLTFGFPHWRRWVLGLTMFAWISGLMMLDVLIAPAVMRLVDRVLVDVPRLSFDWDTLLNRLLLLGVMSVVGVFGVPVGISIRLGWRVFFRQRWRSRRRRLRRRRMT